MNQFILLLVLIFGSCFANGQTTKSTSKSKSKIVSKSNKESKSLQINSDDNSYSLNAKYPTKYDKKVKTLATKYFGNVSDQGSNWMEWNTSDLEVSIKKGKLSVEADYAQTKSLKDFEKEFKEILGLKNPPTPPTPPASI